MIALPDSRAGGMENWGLITFKESRLLFTSGMSSELDRQYDVSAITHELAHQVNNYSLTYFICVE